MFHLIDWESWPRRDHFNYYYNQIKCRYTLTAHIDIAPLREFQKQRRLRFFPLMLYAIMRAVNENREFRMSFDGDGRLGYWDVVVPCYTVFHEEDKTFSDIWSEYDGDLRAFYDGVAADIETCVLYRRCRGFISRPFLRIRMLKIPSCFPSSASENSRLPGKRCCCRWPSQFITPWPTGITRAS